MRKHEALTCVRVYILLYMQLAKFHVTFGIGLVTMSLNEAITFRPKIDAGIMGHL